MMRLTSLYRGATSDRRGGWGYRVFDVRLVSSPVAGSWQRFARIGIGFLPAADGLEAAFNSTRLKGKTFVRPPKAGRSAAANRIPALSEQSIIEIARARKTV
jgi:hypothetical protein